MAAERRQLQQDMEAVQTMGSVFQKGGGGGDAAEVVTEVVIAVATWCLTAWWQPRRTPWGWVRWHRAGSRGSGAPPPPPSASRQPLGAQPPTRAQRLWLAVLCPQAHARDWVARRKPKPRRMTKLGTPITHPMTKLIVPISRYYAPPQPQEQRRTPSSRHTPSSHRAGAGGTKGTPPSRKTPSRASTGGGGARASSSRMPLASKAEMATERLARISKPRRGVSPAPGDLTDEQLQAKAQVARQRQVEAILSRED